MCEYSNSYFESEHFVTLVLHILTVIEVPLHLFGGFMILFRTPKKMEMVRGVLLVLHVWESVLDLFLSLGNPMIYYPGAFGYSNGIHHIYGLPPSIQIYLMISGLGGLAAAICTTFENRYHRIVHTNSTTLLRSWKRLSLTLFNYIFSFTFLLPIYMTAESQEAGKAYYRKLLPCLHEEIFNREGFFVLTTNVPFLCASLGAIIIFLVAQIFFYISFTLVKLKSLKILSKNTYKMQHKLFISLCYQASVLAVAILLPCAHIVFSFITGYFNQVMNNLSLILFCLHGTFSTIVMLVIHTPYRQAIQNMISIRKPTQFVPPSLS